MTERKLRPVLPILAIEMSLVAIIAFTLHDWFGWPLPTLGGTLWLWEMFLLLPILFLAIHAIVEWRKK